MAQTDMSVLEISTWIIYAVIAFIVGLILSIPLFEHVIRPLLDRWW